MPSKPRQSVRFEEVDGHYCAWIPLTQGKWALIDAGDTFLVGGQLWHIVNGYACAEPANGDQRFMHRAIAEPGEGMFVDHINGNKLDNRRSNLREATKSQNACNMKLSARNTTGHKGLKLHKKCGRWEARIGYLNAKIYLGLFATKEEAITARLKAEVELHGTFRRVA